MHYRGTLSAGASDSGWIAFTADKVAAATRRAPGGSSAPGTAATFAVGAMTISCGGAPFGEKPTTETQTPGAALRSLRSAVDGIATLKEPFQSDLLDTIDTAIRALAADNLDEVRAPLDDIITALQAALLQAQLTTAKRNQLTNAAKRIETQIGR